MLKMENVVCVQAQFCATFLHSLQLCFRDCGFPRFTLIFTLPNSVFFYFLFRDFYDKAYCPAPEPVGEYNKGVERGRPKLGEAQSWSSPKAKCD